MSLWLSYILLAGLAGTSAPADATERHESDAPPPVQRTGDQITLKSGRVLHGIKIVRQTPIDLTLEVIPGVEPLIIPAKQVSSIKYGALAPRYEQPPPLGPREREMRIDVLSASKTSPELIEKMREPFTDERLLFESQDIVSILYILAIMSSVPVKIDASVEKRPLADREATFALAPGTTMEAFIDGVLASEMPWLNVRYQLDALHVEVRERAAPRKAGKGRPEKDRSGDASSTGP